MAVSLYWGLSLEPAARANGTNHVILAATNDVLSAMVEQIAVSTQQQALGSGEVNTAVTPMDQAMQQNATMVEQLSAVSHSLAREEEALTRLVGQFRAWLEVV